MATKQRKIEINYRLLQTSCNIEVVGSVPDMQVYQADKAEYTPDYTLTPLVLFPRCNATDPEAVTKIGAVNSRLTNMKWYERIGTTRTLITSTNTGYSITESGDSKGQITMKKNVTVLKPVTLEFYAEYADTRTGQLFTFQMSRLVRAVDGTDAIPVLTIDSPSTLDWNPVRDITAQTITAKLMVGDTDVTATGKCKFFWYRLLSTGALEAITTGAGDNDWEFVSLNKNVYKIDRNYIGDDITIVCKATYAASGTPASTPGTSDPAVSTVIRRRIPKIEADWEGVPTGVPDGTYAIFPRPVIRDTMGVIPNPSAMFNCHWYVKKSGDAGYAKVADGYSPRIPFSNGMMLKLELQNRGYTVVMTRESNDVDISNKERADIATAAGAAATIRIHADGVDSASASGASVLVPGSSNPYIPELAGSSSQLGSCIINSYCAATGMKNRGVVGSDNMTGINWSTNPVALLELGFMTNPTDDANMQDDTYQQLMVHGIADGIDAYFGRYWRLM